MNKLIKHSHVLIKKKKKVKTMRKMGPPKPSFKLETKIHLSTTAPTGVT